MKLFSLLLDFLLPPSCPVCGAMVDEHGRMCAECWGKFNWISDPKCCVCGYPFPANIDLGDAPMCPTCAAGKNELDWLRSACVYDDVSKNIMLPFKHAGALKYRLVMSRAMINSLRELSNKQQGISNKSSSENNLPTQTKSLLMPYCLCPDVILPVPLATRRLWKRGYNQATVLARPIAKHFGVPIDHDSVRRKYRPDMGHMTASARTENIRGVFRVARPDRIRGKTILLVDDVMTTGATFHELRRVLKRAGAASVIGVTFCRVVRAI